MLVTVVVTPVPPSKFKVSVPGVMLSSVPVSAPTKKATGAGLASIFILLLVTVVVTPVPPSKFKVSVPTLIVSSVPVSAPTDKSCSPTTLLVQ